MNERFRKADQMVAYTGLLLPTGSTVERQCDLVSCVRPATDLVSEPDGSVLFVCEQHQADLTTPAQEDLGTPAAADVDTPATEKVTEVSVQSSRDGVPGVRKTPSRHRVRALAVVVIGLILVAFGLWACGEDPESHLSGLLPGVVGTWLVLRTARPRYRL